MISKKMSNMTIFSPTSEQEGKDNVQAKPAVSSNQAVRVREMAKLSKKFMRYSEAAAFYSIGKTKLQALAKEAHAVYKVDKVALINCEIFEQFLESFRV